MIVCEFDMFEVGRDDPIAPDEFKKVLPTKAQLFECLNVRMFEWRFRKFRV